MYRDAGWTGVLPLPAGAKSPPPRGYTGWAGVDPSGADVQAWVEGETTAVGNIGLRLPRGVYGLDVDDYGAKTGGVALGRLVEAYGPLPATWIITSREASSSGIRLFRAEPALGTRWRDEPAGHGAGIEAIHFGHRYAVTWPSVHPDTGRKYFLRRPDGIVAGDGEIPRPDDLPAMPQHWVFGLAELGEVRTGEMAGHDETVAVVTGWREGEACPRVATAHERAHGGLRAASDGAALHPVALAALHELTNLGHEGHVGVRRALAEHFSHFVEVRAGRDAGGRAPAEAEWWRMVRGAVGKLVGAPRETCDCGLWAGDGLLFDPVAEGVWAVPPLNIAPAAPDDPWPEEAWLGPLPPGYGQTGSNAIAITPDATGQDLPVGDMADLLIGRMLTATALRDRPAPAPLISGLLTLDSASWLIARSGSYKSFLALDWAAHVAAGRPWMGRQVAAGRVVYVVAEGVGGMGPRIRAWEQRNGPMSSDLLFVPVPIQVAREEHWAALVEASRRLDARMIILDTQARISVGLDENDNSAMGEMIESIERLRRASGACVLTVHHIGRSGRDARGASAIDAAQDTELRLTRTADRRVVLEVDKSRHADDDVRVELELFLTELDGGGTSLVVGPPLDGVSAGPDWLANLTLNQQTVARVVADIFPDAGATKAEIKAEALKRPRLKVDGAFLEAMGDSAFRRSWDSLVGAGRLVRVEGSQRYVLGPDEPLGDPGAPVAAPINPWTVDTDE